MLAHERPNMSSLEITARRVFERVTPDTLAGFRDTPTGFVVDAQSRNGALDFRIKPVTSHAAFVGTALTVKCRPWDNLAAHVAITMAQPGDVLIITVGNFDQAAVIGEKYVGMARNQGVVAIVTDGLVRDAAGINSVGIPVFARGVIPNSSFKNGPGEVGLPISIGGMPVNSGDVLIGDSDGVVVVARREAAAVAARLIAINESEREMFKAIIGGAPKPERMTAITAGLAIRYVD